MFVLDKPLIAKGEILQCDSKLGLPKQLWLLDKVIESDILLVGPQAALISNMTSPETIFEEHILVEGNVYIIGNILTEKDLN